MGNVLDSVEGVDGFYLGQMHNRELNELRQLIREQYLGRLAAFTGTSVEPFKERTMSEYHTLSGQVDHRGLWPKSARILGADAVNRFRAMPFFQNLVAELGDIQITAEDGTPWEEVYWRIVRPGDSDIGSLHADKWFWDLGHGSIPEGKKRIKIWIALEAVPGKSGLRIVPGSHFRDDIQYHGEVDHTGKSKPKLDTPESELDIYNVPAEPGDFIVFHDNLLHGGMQNQSDKTRVSLECTMLVKSN